MTENHQSRAEAELGDGIAGSILAFAVLKAGGEVRVRFRDLWRAKLTVTHDAATDEWVLRAMERIAGPQSVVQGHPDNRKD